MLLEVFVQREDRLDRWLEEVITPRESVTEPVAIDVRGIDGQGMLGASGGRPSRFVTHSAVGSMTVVRAAGDAGRVASGQAAQGASYSRVGTVPGREGCSRRSFRSGPSPLQALCQGQ